MRSFTTFEQQKRLDALAHYGILDTPPEPEFDDIVQIAQRICRTPVALVSFVALDRQWFKARIGFPSCQTPLTQSVCAFALDATDVLVIPDLTADPRTRENTLVTGEPYMRFYAGAPLRTPEGVAIGSLCVIDTEPRPAGLTQEEKETLTALARQTVVVMVLRKAMEGREVALAEQRRANEAALERILQSEKARERLHDAEALMREAQEAARIGAFEVDIKSNMFQVTAEFCRIFGVPPQETYPAADLENQILLVDRTMVASSRLTREDGSANHDVEYRVRRLSDGALRWIWRRGSFDFDASGTPIRMLGVIQDITERKLVDIRTRALIALGDRLRHATTPRQVAEIASQILAETLGAARAGLAGLDDAAGLFIVENDWTAPGAKSLAGTWPIDNFKTTIKNLANGMPLAVANVPAATWLANDVTAYVALGVGAQINVPAIHNGDVVGVLFVHSAEPRTWSPSEIDFAVAVADRTYAILGRLKAEAHQRVLNEELSHRLKNTLAMVQAIISQTLRGQVERGTIRSLEDRVIALSKAHDILLQDSWTAAPMTAVLGNVLDLHGRRPDFDLSGPDVMLNPKATLALALLLHEMTTNSIKYGALSVPDGRVAMRWDVGAFGADPTFALHWSERGGPPAKAPQAKGFGSRLIAMGLAGAGGVTLDYRPSGLDAQFTAPLRSIATIASSDIDRAPTGDLAGSP